MTTRLHRLADRIARIAPSPTMKGTIEAERLRAAGMDVVDLGAGEPDFATPPHIVAAAHAALDAGFTKYTANTGTAELCAAVAARYREDAGVAYAPEDVIITAGGKQALFHAALALFGRGDQVITHTPGWPTIVEQVKLAGAEPVLVAAGGDVGFALTADLFLQAVTPRTRGIVINTPANPTGAVMTEREARRLALEAARRDLWIVLDLCYDRLAYDDPVPNLVQVFSETMRDGVVLCGSLSKTYAMTGWRCGWLAGPSIVARAAAALQSHETSNVNSIAQKAAVAALTGPQQCVVDMRDEYRRRRDRLIRLLAEEPLLRTTVPDGAFYLFPDVSRALSASGCRTSMEFADRLLRDEHVVTTAGEAFGAPGYIRLSYAASLERLEEGARRLIRFTRAVAP
jgi:aspartate aminotransferase